MEIQLNENFRVKGVPMNFVIEEKKLKAKKRR